MPRHTEYQRASLPEAGSQSVGTSYGIVAIDSGCVALVLEQGHNMAVYNLFDNHTGGVRVTVGQQVINLAPGKQLVLSDAAGANFDSVNPGRKIPYRDLKQINLGNRISAFTTEFSMPGALFTIAPIKQMIRSGNSSSKLKNLLFKNAAILQQLGAANGPYRGSSAAN